jgi:tripartite ATP-independent transporter DctM subunit
MLTTLIICFVVLASLRMPVAIALGIAASVSLFFFSDVPLAAVGHKMVNMVNNYAFIAIPLFVFAGRIMNAAGITDRLFNFARVLVGHITGGLAHANVLAGMFFSAISGSAAAAVGGLGEIEMRAMKKQGFDEPFSASVTVAASVLGPVIPPSIPLIIYASMTDNSIGKLFLGGIVPGILLALSLMVLIFIISKIKNYPRDPFPTWTRFKSGLKEGFLPLMMPVIMLGGIYSGIFTPNEAAAVAGVYALLLGFFVYKTLSVKDLPKVFTEAMIAATIILFIISTTSTFSYILTIEHAGEIITNAFLSLSENKYVILLMLNIILLFFGALMEAGVVLILFIPILYPLAMNLGFDPIHFGVIMALNLMIGVATPPLGVSLFMMKHISGIKLEMLMRKILPFLIPLIIILLLISYIPELVTYLPSLYK